MLGITRADIFAEGLNFIFGMAESDSLDGPKAALISTCRLRNEFWKAPSDQAQFIQRTLKEAVHELTIARLAAALNEAKYNQRKAAQSLGMSYHQFRGLYRKHLPEIEKRRGH